MDNMLILARLKLFRKNYLSFVKPSLTAWFFALIAGLIFNVKRLRFLENEKRVLLKNRTLNVSPKFHEDLCENQRLSLVCWLNIVKNLFDFVPASSESGAFIRNFTTLQGEVQ